MINNLNHDKQLKLFWICRGQFCKYLLYDKQYVWIIRYYNYVITHLLSYSITSIRDPGRNGENWDETYYPPKRHSPVGVFVVVELQRGILVSLKYYDSLKKGSDVIIQHSHTNHAPFIIGTLKSNRCRWFHIMIQFCSFKYYVYKKKWWNNR